jgi:tetratricopeptide (TPR) repeat protein
MYPLREHGKEGQLSLLGEAMAKRWTFSFSVRTKKGTRNSSSKAGEAKLLAQLKKREVEFEELLLKVSQFYSDTDRPGKAFSYMRRLKMCAREPETKAFCYLSMGQLMQQTRDHKSAFVAYMKGFMLEPSRPATWYLLHNNLASCLNHFEQYAEAEWYCREAVKIRASRHDAYRTLGISLEGQGRYPEAADAYIKAIRKDASDPVSLRLLETLLEEHPEVIMDRKDIQEQLKKCRIAVRIGTKLGRREKK